MAFATVQQYVARYGETSSEERLRVLLEDASTLMLSYYEPEYGTYEEGANRTFDANAEAVCCMIVNRVLSAPAALVGASQYSQSAGGYSASVTYGSALGEMYLGKTDLKRLGLGGQTMGSMLPKERA